MFSDIVCMAAFMLAAASPAGAIAAETGKCGEVLWSTAITGEGVRYCGWPTLCRRASGELIVAFSGDRDRHVCPWGKVQLVRSADGGRTWTKPETVVNDPLDDRDGGIMELSNGDLVLTYFTSVAFSSNDEYGRHFGKIEHRDFEEYFGNFTRRSTDGGKTWENPVRTVGSAPHGGIRDTIITVIYSMIIPQALMNFNRKLFACFLNLCFGRFKAVRSFPVLPCRRARETV